MEKKMSLSDLISKYKSDDYPGPGAHAVNMSTRIDAHVKLKLDFLSHHLNRKKTPLFREIVEAGINEMFESLSDDFDSELQQAYAEEFENLDKEIHE
jgi:predicted DNA-binding protein